MSCRHRTADQEQNATILRKCDAVNQQSKAATRGPTASSMSSSSCFFIKLADESFKKTDLTDEDGYDSYHERETDVCHDSESEAESEILFRSDSSFHSSDIEVLEYEIASSTDQEDDENNSFCSESSAATDDYFNEPTQDLSSSSDFSEIVFFADTEESDDPEVDDPELSKADYWKCVKCKNEQNNPLYRYCEKCYQVRKSHFPPRPRTRKDRPRHRKVKVLQSSAVSQSTVGAKFGKPNSYPSPSVEKPSSSKPLLCRRASINRSACPPSKRRNNGSAGESSSSDSGGGSGDDNEPIVKRRHISSLCAASGSSQEPVQPSSYESYLQLQLSQNGKDSGQGSSQESCFDMKETTFSTVATRSLSDEDVRRKPEKVAPLVATKSAPIASKSSDETHGDSLLCKICESNPKGAVFVHTTKACGGSCYTCALKTWKLYKYCPFCKLKPKNVMKLFSH